MAKKLEQGQKYPKGFTQMRILLKLCEKDRTPTSEILDFLKDQYYIREQKNIREHHLKTLEKQKLIRRESAGRGHPDYWSVIPDFRVLKELVDRLKRVRSDILQMLAQLPMLKELVDRLKHDLDSQTAFMRSQYYRSMTHVLADRVCKLMPPPDMEVDTLADVLGISWLALKWVLHFISATDDERNDILQKLAGSTKNPVISPAAARAAGLERGFGGGLNAASPFVTNPERMVLFVSVDGKELICFNDLLKLTDTGSRVAFAFEEPRRFDAALRLSNYPLAQKFGKRIDDRTIKSVEPPINWNGFFAKLADMNENYPYLFD